MRDNELFKRMKQEIDEIPVIDLHSHMRLDKPNATNLAEILFYHMVCWELISAGKDIRKDLPTFANPMPEKNEVIEEALAKYIPYFEEIKNTTTYWALKKIFEDLYEFDFESINSTNWRPIYDKILKKANDDTWTEYVLLEKAKVDRIVATVNDIGRLKEIGQKWITKGLFSPTFEGNLLRQIEPDLLSGKSIKESLRDFFLKCRKAGVMSITGMGNVNEFIKVSNTEGEELREKWLREKSFTRIENNRFLNLVLEIANEVEMPWVMPFGVTGTSFPEIDPGHGIIVVDHSDIPQLCKAVYEYKRVKIFTYAPSYPLSQEVCTAARMFPNIYPMGFQWHGLFFPYIERMIEERLQTLPMTKPIGFMSDAYCSEWFYGKLSIVRLALTKVLSQKVEEGLYTEKLALKIARCWLYKNPKEAYFG